MVTTETSGGSCLLDSQRILVTGGSGQIGRGICATAARHGARVAFTWSRNQEGAARTEEVIHNTGAPAFAIRADLRAGQAVVEAVATLESEWGGIDCLVNNAGVSESLPFILIDDDELADVMATNFVAAFRLTREVARGMIRRKYGRIINISSIAGSRAIPGPVHYAASKGALEGMTRSLAHELGPYGILVNAIAAGVFEGGLRATIPEHHQRRYVDACALGRFGRADECGELVCWLASPSNTYLTGTVLFQDGGTIG